MSSWPCISRVSARLPTLKDRERGAVCMGAFRHGLLRIAFTVYRGPNGLTIQLPCRGGRPLAWPVDEPARRAIEAAVVDALRNRGMVR